MDDGTGWDEMEWEGAGQDGMGWDGSGWDRTGGDRIGMGWEGGSRVLIQTFKHQDMKAAARLLYPFNKSTLI